MARFGEMLGFADNPFYKTFDANRSALVSGFAGIGADPLNPAGGFSRGFANGMQIDDQRAQMDAEAEQRKQQINQTAAFLRSKGAEDLAAAVEGGMTSGADAFNAWYQQANASPDYTAEQQNYLFAQQNPGFADFMGQGGTDPTSAMQEYEYARQQGYQGDFTSWKTDIARAGATNVGMNNSEALAAGYADRMSNSNSILSDPAVEASMVDPVQSGANAVPFAGNFITSNERKIAEQAKRDFINAILRRESGAAIAESEFANADRQYFPQPGDTPQVIEQKRRNREIAIQGVSRAAGGSYQQPALGGGAGWQVVGVE